MQLWRNTAGGGSSHFLIRLNIQVWGIPESDSAGCPTLHGITRALGWGKPIVVETPISNNVGGVKHFSSTRRHALEEERHFALVEAFAFALPTKARSQSGSG